MVINGHFNVYGNMWTFYIFFRSNLFSNLFLQNAIITKCFNFNQMETVRVKEFLNREMKMKHIQSFNKQFAGVLSLVIIYLKKGIV